MSETTGRQGYGKAVAILTVAAAIGGLLILNSVLPSVPDDVIRMAGSVML